MTRSIRADRGCSSRDARKATLRAYVTTSMTRSLRSCSRSPRLNLQWRDPWVLPQCIGKLLDVLSNHAPSAIGAASRTPLTVGPGVIYRLPNHLKYERTATIVRGESREGAQMLARFAAQGFPPALIDAGFKEVSDFWEPWMRCHGRRADCRDSICGAPWRHRCGNRRLYVSEISLARIRGRGHGRMVIAAEPRWLRFSTALRGRTDPPSASPPAWTYG